MKKPFKAGLIQMRMQADKESNLAHAIELLEKAGKQGVQIACLPELFLSPYFCQTEDHAVFALAEEIPGPTTEALSKVAKRYDMAIVASLFEKRMSGIYHNTTAVIDADGAFLGVYRKMHIPDDPLYYEKFYFTPGDLGFKNFQTKHGTIGVLICWDQWFPEAARLTALQGADILFYPTAIGWHPKEKAQYGAQQADAWETVQRGHAIANGIYVAGINRIGHEGELPGGIEFWGGTFLANPSGQLLAKASRDQEEIIIQEIDPRLVETTRQHWPFFRDRRIDAYHPITQRAG